MPMDPSSPPDPRDRAWRGAPPVPRFLVARRKTGSAAGVGLGLAAGGALFALMDAVLAGAGPIADAAATGVAALPPGFAIGYSSGRDFHAALKSGVWFAFASSAVYAWAFAGGWV